MRRPAAVLVAACWLALGSVSAQAAAATWSPAELEQQFMCLPCNQRLDQSQSGFALGLQQQIKTFHDEGWTEQQVRDYFVKPYGPEVLAAPPKQGFDLLAWLVPAAVLLGGAAVAVALAMAWSRTRGGGGGGPDGGAAAVDDAMARRIDRELQELEE